MLISRFLVSAKKVLGPIHVSALHDDPNYAAEIMLRALMSGDHDLIEHARNLMIELNLNMSLLRGMEQYLHACKSSQPSEVVERTQGLLIKMLPFIHPLSIHGDRYRQAVDAFLASIDREDVPDALNVVREFYFFWNEESPGEEETSFDSVFQYLFKLIPGQSLLFEKWQEIDKVKLSLEEHDTLQAYVDALSDQAFQLDVISTRKRLAKIIVLELRDKAHASQHYRRVVNKLLASVHKTELKPEVTQIAREFYHFWKQEPEAAQFIRA